MTPAAVAGGAGASVRHWYKIEDPEKEGDRQEFSMQGISPPKVDEDQILEVNAIWDQKNGHCPPSLQSWCCLQQ